MIFVPINKLETLLRLENVSAQQLYDHFMCHGDEVLYVLEGDMLYGVVTPGDLFRHFWWGESLINRDYSYVGNKSAFRHAEDMLDKITNLHELPVLEKGHFVGIIKSGKRKSYQEWKDIRLSFAIEPGSLERERIEWFEEDIKRLLSLGCSFYIYRWLDIRDMGLSDEEMEFFEEKRIKCASPEGFLNLTKYEQMQFLNSNMGGLIYPR